MAALCHCATRFFIHVFLFVTNSSSASSSSTSSSLEDAQPDSANNSISDWSEMCNSTSLPRGNCQLQDVIECIEFTMPQAVLQNKAGDRMRDRLTNTNKGFEMIVMKMYMVPVLIPLGVGGSVLGMVVLLATFLRFKFFSHLLACINLSSAAFLLTVLLTWLAQNQVDVFSIPGLCQLQIFSSHFFTFLSVWSGVLGAYLVLYDWLRPGVLGWLQSPTAAKTMVLGLSVLGFTIYSYKTWTYFSMVHKGYRVCTVIPENKAVMEILNVLDVHLLLVLPSVLHVLLVMIVVCARIHPHCHCCQVCSQRVWVRRRHLQGRAYSATPPGGAIPEEEMTSSRRSVRRHWREVHRLVLSQSVCFLLLVTPQAVFTLIVSVHRWVYLHKASTDDILLHHVFQFSFYIYFTILPYCPIFSSDKFRQHCFSLLKRRRPRRAKHIERLLSGTIYRQ